MRTWAWLTAGGAFWMASLVGARAQAQEPVYVRLAAPGRDLTVLTPEGRELAACRERCDFWAWPGKYRVRMRHGEERTTSSLRVRSPGSYEYDPGDIPLKSAGLFLGITGAVVTFVGAVITVAAGMSTGCDDEAGHCERNPAVYWGLGAMGVGAGTGTLGFVLFAKNRAGFRYREPEATSARLGVGVLPLPAGSRAGVALGLDLAF